VKRALAIAAAAVLAAIAGLVILYVAVYLGNHSLTDELGHLKRFDSPQAYLTAAEAYEVALPAVHYWHADAVITGIDGSAREEPSGLQVHPDGRLAWWTLGACSDTAGKWVTIVVFKGSVSVGVTDKPWGHTTGPCDEFSLAGVIGSEVAVQRAMTAVPSSTVRWIRPSTIDPFTGNSLPLSWMVELDKPDGNVVEVWVDASTAEILAAYFARGEPFPIETP
jgi:hypothetical protein